MKPARVALVHDWVTGMRGGEYVLEALAELFVEPELFTLLRVPGAAKGSIAQLPCNSTWLQQVPASDRYYRHFLPLMPTLIGSFDLNAFDLIVSSSHCVAKGVRKAAGSVHVSYVHAPMRYMWDGFDDYFGSGKAALPVRAAAHACRPYLQRWDRAVSSAKRVDRLVANSAFTAERVRRAYGREPSVVHPFANVARFGRPRQPRSYYLMVGALAPNKRVDLAVEAFNHLRLPLLIVGRGQDEAKLVARAGPSVRFLGSLSNASIDELYATARALVFPGLEDFGITPVEAMAAGLPVVAYAAGGALETVVDGESGLWFREPSAQALAAAIERIEAGRVAFDEARVRLRGQAFAKDRFQQKMLREIHQTWSAAGKSPARLRRALRIQQSPDHDLPGGGSARAA
jgi:glycosyltransferase involved in cell wall biosynthesis